jgi:Rad3-related DNA helicase
MGVRPPHPGTEEKGIIRWAVEILHPSLDRLIRMLQAERALSGVQRSLLTEVTRVQAKLQVVSDEPDPSNWVVDDSAHSWTFRPVRVHLHANKYLWRHGYRHLIISATIISVEQFSEDLGIPPEQVTFVNLPCSFPKERRPIVVANGVDMSYRNRARGAWARLVSELDTVLDATLAVKTLVHTVSHDLTRYIRSGSRHRDRMLAYPQADSDRGEILGQFAASAPGTILVAAGWDRGVDMPHDLCRCAIITKVPFPSLGDRQIAKRLQHRSGQAWYTVNTVRSFCQMIGRGMRSADDWCVCIVLDSQFRGLYVKNSDLFPEHVREALHFESLPRGSVRLARPPTPCR